MPQPANAPQLTALQPTVVQVQLSDFEQVLREAEQGEPGANNKKMKFQMKNKGRTKPRKERLTADEIEALQQAAAKRQVDKMAGNAAECDEIPTDVQVAYFTQRAAGFRLQGMQ